MSTSSPETAPAGAVDPLASLLDTLDLEAIDRDIFRGKSPPTSLQRVFGGQVAAQALVAAQRTVPDRPVHSLHAYFLRPGAPELPIVYEVDRIRDGRTYVTRRVVGIQNGKAIFNLQASFHTPEAGYDSQLPMPDAGGADPSSLPAWKHRLMDDEDHRPAPWVPFEMRQAPTTAGYGRLLWMRTVGPVDDDPVLQSCLLAYASDMTLISVTLESQDPPVWPPAFVASLDHAMWFHRPFRIDEWMLYAQLSPSTGDGRGLAIGHFFTREGLLAVTVVQEGALRP